MTDPRSNLIAPLTVQDIQSDPSHKPLWWRSRGTCFDWASELVNSSAADEVMVEWGKALKPILNK